MKAYLKNYRMSPRKVRLVADAVKNKNVQVADVELSFMPKKAARIIRTLIRSAVSNAVNNEGKQAEDLVVKNIEVNQGMTLKRWRARARGAAFPINKRTSNISVELADKVNGKAGENGLSQKTQKAEKKTAQKKEETKKVETKADKKPATKKTAQKETK